MVIFVLCVFLLTRVHDLLTPLDDKDLDEKVTQILQHQPNCGYKMMLGHLNAQGIHIQRQRVQDSMRRVDPHGVLLRTLQLNPQRRRRYSVPAPNSLWHIDGNHKLIRIERLWRDVYVGVLDLFYTIFNNLETEGFLNPDNEVHLYALHLCFVPHIQKHLDVFKYGWNCHRLSTEGNLSPLQLWTHHERDAQQEPVQVDVEYGVDWTGPPGYRQQDVVVPEVQLQRPLTEQEVESLPKPDGPLSDVLDSYIETVNLLSEMLQ
ncbi:uncharacterized protein LOC121652157 isoform X2 [Melanotaenia boesemani]|uniref:uncharacterized protein LOC121652157 isoform X2 n=1 Tax=Melanotaenia boesemani TaxID=1250792 RepID=UPI001C058068|nr:uncharacterized protein LOC121652157 isoform X2 [Melanotaenia boesemani]